MLDLPLEPDAHHLDHVLALGAYAEQYRTDPAGARERVLAAFDLPGDLNDDLLLCALLLLAGCRFDDARPLLQQVGESAPEKIPAVYAALASVFKYFNRGLAIGELAAYGIDPLLAIYRRHPSRVEAQRAMLDMLLYFGLADDAAVVLEQGDRAALADEARELADYRSRLDGYAERCRLSVVLLTYRRPALLRHTLTALRAALAERDVEIIVGVNDDLAETRQVLAEAGVDRVLCNTHNTGLNFYRQVFAEAGGRYLLEIDDDVAAFPPGFDRQIIACLETRGDIGLVGHWPAGFLDARDGTPQPAVTASHERSLVAGLPFGFGPVAGVCAGMRRRDYLEINGLARASLGKHSGEEPQLIRKLALRGKLSGVIFDQGLQVYQND